MKIPEKYFALVKKYSNSDDSWVADKFAGVPQGRRHFCKRATVAQKSFSAPDEY